MKKLQIAVTRKEAEAELCGVTLRIARAGNDAFLTKYRNLILGKDLDNISDKESREILCTAMAGTVLVGWDGFEIDGEPVEFNEDNAASLLFHDELAREKVSFTANDIDNFIIKANSSTKGKS
jgi:hypothetical protein